MVENAFTRWLSHDNVTRAFIDIFVPLIRTLEDLQYSDDIAKGLLRFFKTDQFVYTLLHMRDVLPLMLTWWL